MTEVAKAVALRQVSLDDKWDLANGYVLLNGSQTIGRILLEQKERDRRQGLNTAGYVTGYRGSPLGNVDSALWSIGSRLEQADIVFQPGLNEDIAATAVRGSQQLNAVAGPRFDGVFAAWYGKGPGVDRSGDAFKHGNYAGTHANGGVLLFYGDDHGSKSSSLCHHSEQALAANSVPSLYPANVQELLEYGLLGYALSRYSGLWVGIKCVNEVADQTATVDLDRTAILPVAPPRSDAVNIHINPHGPFNPLLEERIVVDHRLPLVEAFCRANNVDRVRVGDEHARFGILTAGKAFEDVRGGLELLGIDDSRARTLGLAVYKVGCIWPLERTGLRDFARGKDEVFAIEEKASFLEDQAAKILVNEAERPRLVGKRDETGQSLISNVDALDSLSVARTLVARLTALGMVDHDLQLAIDELPASAAVLDPSAPRRLPYFCSGCPHNRSTVVPEGSMSMSGIGCHTMVTYTRPATALLPTHMGAEGGNWIGLAPFTDTKHIFQNMGDGTYYHSGLLAIRAAVAAKVNITYKILYNDAVAMTGGQPVDGPLSVSDIAHQVRAEGVEQIVLLSDDPTRHDKSTMPAGVTIGHRDTLDAVQRGLREMPGCTVLIYEQTCAAEKRRRRKRGTFPNPPKRLFISKDVCEGCGDCSVQSTCVSLMPVETEFGRKRAIDQSSCNKDYSCLNGFCPSFITVRGAEPRKPKGVGVDSSRLDSLPPAKVAETTGGSFNMMVAGIGGTGVITVGALIGMAAHIEGKMASLYDMTGLSQKNGAVFSHVRIADDPAQLTTQRVSAKSADILLAFDLVAALAPDSASSLGEGRTKVLANMDVTATAVFQFDRGAQLDQFLMLGKLKRMVGEGAIETINASSLALAILGDTIGANLFMVGVAAQRGLLPVSVAAIEQAIALNGVAIPFNLHALRLGRLFVTDPGYVAALASHGRGKDAPVPASLNEVVSHRAEHLTVYQDAKLAEQYRELVQRVAEAERRAVPGKDDLALAVARNYAKLLAYKDEYEVARLLSSPKLRTELEETFEKGGKISFNLAPPALGGKAIGGRVPKKEFGRWMLPVLGVLARLRPLRGTMLDPFGYTAERRMERSLAKQYQSLAVRIVDGLTEANHAQAVTALNLADMVRGYGPVKDVAVEKYQSQVEEAEQAFRLAGEPTVLIEKAELDDATAR